MPTYCVTLFDTIENPIDNNSCFITSTQNLTINRGSSYKVIYKLYKDGSPVNLAGHSLRGTIKPSSISSTILLNLTSANLLLEIDYANSAIVMNLKESFTRRITIASAVYDIEIINSIGDASKIITGLMTFI